MSDRTTQTDKLLEAARIQEVVDDWSGVLLNTQPMNRDGAAEAILCLYDAAKNPRPMAARAESEKGAGLEVIYCTSIRDYIAKAMKFAERIAATDTAARGFTEVQARGAVFTPWSDGNWLAADDYYVRWVEKDKGAEKSSHPIEHLKQFARNGFALATFAKAAFIVERPNRIVYREHGQELQWHHDGGPVLEWADGDRMYALEGFFVDEQLVMHPEAQTIEQIHGEENLELRRIRIERFGWENYLKRTNAKVLDKRRNDVDGGCYEMLCSVERLEAHILVCTCATGRTFALLVPETCTTCTVAQTYLAGNPKFVGIGRT